MKKFTLSALAVSSVLLMSAGAPKGVVLPTTSNNAFSLNKMTELAETSKHVSLINSSKTQVNLERSQAIRMDAAEATEDETTTTEGDLATYAYPDGTFFTTITFVDSKTNRIGGFYGNALMPYGKSTWRNLTFNPTTGYVVENPTSEWEYTNSLYGYSKPLFSFNSNDVDLTFDAAPCPIENYAVDVPTLVANGSTYAPTDAGGYALSVAYGGNGGLNPAAVKFYETDTRYGYKNFSVSAYMANVNSKALLTEYGYNNMMAAGTSTGLYNTPGNTVRENFIKNNNIEIPENSTFCGFGQIFNTGTVAPILKTISLTAVAQLDEGDEITYNLLDLTHNKYITGIVYTCEKAVPAGYIVDLSVEIFDEETELEYIALEPNTSYLLYVDGISTLKDFNPMLMAFDINNNMQSPEGFGGNVYQLYTNEEGTLDAIDASYYAKDCTGAVSGSGFAPSMAWQLGLEYPYIVPEFSLVDAQGSELVDYKVSDTEISPKFFNFQGTNVCQFYVNSDLGQEALMNSIEYSSEDLKKSITVAMKTTDGIQGSAYVFSSSEKMVQIHYTADVTTDSWIKFNNKNTYLKVNVPAYETSAIGSVVADGEAVATELYDLQGRKLSGDAQGIVIKKMTMADGSVKTVKVVK